MINCYDPSEQVFGLKGKVIAIEWGKSGDKAVKLVIRKENNETFIVENHEFMEGESE